jgi:hypothetical protein
MQHVRSASVAALVLLLLFGHLASAQSLNEVLGAVSQNVKVLEDQLPDFVCSEKIVSTQFDNGRVIKQKVVDSVFTGFQRAREENRLRFGFTESREVVAIDGKPVRKGTAFPKLPYRFSGGFSSLLTTTFSPDNLDIHNYSIADTYRSQNGNAILMRFSTKEGQQKLRSVLQGETLLSKDIGAAWIDQKTFRVLRLQRQSLNLPSDLTRSMATADYGPVTIGEAEFWIPIKVRAEVTERDTTLTVRYEAEYTDCKKFTAEIKISP